MIAVINCTLDAGLVQRHQGKLNCYKEAGAKDQGKPGEEKNPFHLAHHSMGGRVQWGWRLRGGIRPGGGWSGPADAWSEEPPAVSAGA